MNYLDTYDIATSSGGSATPPPNQQPQQSLNEEVNQVIGQLGRFWGGFRKQSQSVLETAKKDFGEVVSQAQKELNKLTTTPTEQGSNEEGRTPSSSHEGEEEEEGEDATPTSSSVATLRDADVNVGATSSTSTSSGPSEPSDTTTTQPQSGWGTQALFSRLQSALPPNVVSTVQTHIPESLRHASENFDLAQMRTNLLSEVQRIQGVTRAQAEEYVHKSEALLRDAMKEAQEVLRDAVKVIPPEEVNNPASGAGSSGLIWDGTDVWMLPAEPEVGNSAATATAGGTGEKGKGVDAGVAAVATRAEALLRRLRHDPAILRLDPGVDDAAKDKYGAWLEKEVTSKENGFENEEWRTKIAEVMDDATDGTALTALKDQLVPSELTEAEFWQRFFFRTHQIREEEEKRKALLQVNTESDDEFDWDDEDSDKEESKQVAEKETTPSKPPVPTATGGDLAPPISASTTRESSLDSFDVVSSANASVSGERPTQASKPTKDDEEDDDDDDDEDEDEEEEEDSDWE